MRIFLLILLFFGISGAVYADALFTYRVVESYPGGEDVVRTENVWVKDHRMKISGSDDTAQIIDVDQYRMCHLNYRAKVYFCVEDDEIKQQMDEMYLELRRQFSERVAGGGGRLADAMAQRDPTNEQALNMEETTEMKQIGPYSCQKIILETPLKRVEAWVASGVAGQGAIKEMFNLMGTAYADIPFLWDTLDVEAKLIEGDRFPVQIITQLRGENGFAYVEDKQLIESREIDIADDEFSPPADFHLVEYAP